jgi:transcriptional regulator with XRE-family HTH domain
MTALYHHSDSLRNTIVNLKRDLLKIMEETNGARLKRLRLEKNLSQKKLAAICGIGQSYLSMLENDERGYGLDIMQIAKVLDTTPDYLQNKKISRVSKPDSDWPFASFSSRQFFKLDPALRQEVEDRLLGAITRLEKTGTHS